MKKGLLTLILLLSFISLNYSIAQSEGDVIFSEYTNDATNENFELMIVNGPVDLRNWALTDNEPNPASNTLIDGNEGYIGFDNSNLWNNLPSGTIIRIISGSSGTNDVTIDQKAGDYLIVQNTNNATNRFIVFDGTATIPSLNLAATGDNLLLVQDSDGNPENGFTNSIDALYYGANSGGTGNDPFGSTTTTQVSSSNNDNGYYFNATDLNDLGNNNSTNWVTSASALPFASYGAPNTDGSNTQNINLYRGTHSSVSSTSISNYSGVGDESVTLSWALPISYSTLKNEVLVIIDDDGTWASGDLPTQFSNLSILNDGGGNYTSGTEFAATSGSFLVYKGDNTSVDVTGLTGGAENYYSRIYTTKDNFMYYLSSDIIIYNSFAGGGPLPVELSSFSASIIGSTIKLSWNTATEVNNYGFEVERASLSASPLRVWEKIGFVNGNGNSNSPKSYSYEDKNVTTGKYSYRLKQIDNDGQFEYSKAIEVDLGAPKKFELSQNYPNPFNPITTIRFNLPEAGNVKLTLFNILGQEIKTLVNEFKESGVHTINFEASELNSGMYIYKLEAGSFVQTRKMTLVK